MNAPRHRSCPSCRALVDPGDEVCPYCGTPLSGVRPAETRFRPEQPPGTLTSYIVGACALLFVLEVISALGAGGSSWGALIDVPPETLFQMGARSGIMIGRGEWWRLVVPVFLHGGLLHILFNGYALIQVGPLAEQAYGRSRFLVIYLAAGILGNVLGVFMNDPRGVGIGASGALFGLIGAAGVYGHRRGDAFGLMIRRVMVQWGLYALIFGFLIGADNAAHIGGLAAGVVLSFLAGDADRRLPFDAIWPPLAAALVLLTFASFGLAIYGYTIYGMVVR